MLADILNFIFQPNKIYFGPFAAGFAVVGAGLGVAAGLASGVFAGVVVPVFAAILGFGIGVGRIGVMPVVVGGVVAAVPGSTGAAAGTSVEIAPLVHIWAKLDLFTSNSIALRFGING